MKIHCNSSEAMIHSAEASTFFEQIISETEIENKEYLLSLFKRVKAIEKVDDEELDVLYNFIMSKEFIDLYNQKIATFTGKKEKLNNLEYSNMLSSFICFMNKSKVIYILDLGADELTYEGKKYLRINIGKKRRVNNRNIRGKVDLDGENENFIKFRNRGKKELKEKFKYIEFIDETKKYLLGIDLRSGMYIVMDKDKNEIILRSKERLEFKQEEKSEYIFVGAGNEELFLLYGDTFVSIKEKIIVHFLGKNLFLINLNDNSILKIGGKISFLGNGKIIEIEGNKITFLNSENNMTLIYDIIRSEFVVE